MGSSERPKRKVQLWRKAAVHFLLCFIMGFFTGFAPTNNSSFSTNQVIKTNGSPEISPEEISGQRLEHDNGNYDRNMLDESLAMKVQERPNYDDIGEKGKEVILTPRRLVIIVTPTSDKDELRGVLSRKMANTLSLVPPPLLWVVVESQTESTEVSDILRKTNVMYRHLVFKENFTDVEIEMDHQRNVALKHIEYHRLSGIVHFASLYNVYDLSFFDEIREIEVFGTWPMAFLSANRQRNSIKFVKEEVLEEETKLKGIPQDGCSKIMLWNLHIPRLIKG